MREEEGRAIADALKVPLSPAMLAALVATVNAQTAPIYANGRALNADERFVAALEAAKLDTPQGTLATVALLAGQHPDPAFVALANAIDDYVSSHYNQISIAQTALVLALTAAGTPKGVTFAVSYAAMILKTAALKQAVETGELSNCEAQWINRTQPLNAIPALGLEGKAAVALAKLLVKELDCGRAGP